MKLLPALKLKHKCGGSLRYFPALVFNGLCNNKFKAFTMGLVNTPWTDHRMEPQFSSNCFTAANCCITPAYHYASFQSFFSTIEFSALLGPFELRWLLSVYWSYAGFSPCLLQRFSNALQYEVIGTNRFMTTALIYMHTLSVKLYPMLRLTL